MSKRQATTTTPSIRASHVVVPAAAEVFCLEDQGLNGSAGWPR